MSAINEYARTTLGEVELLARFIEAMRHAEESARGMAHSRKDERWLVVARNLALVLAKSTEMARRRASS